MRVLPVGFLMMMRRALPSLISSLTLLTSFSPEMLNSSDWGGLVDVFDLVDVLVVFLAGMVMTFYLVMMG